jgi:hypothetical protein
MTAALVWLAVTAAELPLVTQVEQQPLGAQAVRIAEALDYLGAPLPAQVKDGLRAARSPEEIQKLLDPQCLVGVEINPEQRVKVRQGPAAPTLDENGWRTFLVKVANAAGTTAELKVESPHAAPIYKRSSGSPKPSSSIPADAPSQRWMDAELYGKPPLAPRCRASRSSTACCSCIAGTARWRRAPSWRAIQARGQAAFSVGQGTQDLGFRSELDVLFTCRTSSDVQLRVRDTDGSPVTASFTIRDAAGRVYPAPAKRLAPDFFFHAQVYRKDGESVRLPAGRYVVEARRGPEYLVEESQLKRARGRRKVTAHVQLRRWIDPARAGWVSGDHHIHAAGCAHYEDPTQGVSPKDMWRHVLGEDLKVGCSLTWGPCFYFQKRYFTGKVDALSTDRYVMRYDLEVSGWSSHRAGHLVLLRLKDQDYPGPRCSRTGRRWGSMSSAGPRRRARSPGPRTAAGAWPSRARSCPTTRAPLRRHRRQRIHRAGHAPGAWSGGKPVPAVDFMRTVDTPYTWELNMWYQTLNAASARAPAARPISRASTASASAWGART